MSNRNPLTYAVAGVAAVALAFGAYALGNSKSSGGSSGSAQAAAGFQPGSGQAPPGMQPGSSSAGGARQGFGTEATGTAAAKAKTAALAKYDGTVERVDKLPDGSYLVHVITSKGEYHVSVSKTFQVTGAQEGGPGGPGGPPQGSAPRGTVPPQGSTAPPSGASGTSSGSTS